MYYIDQFSIHNYYIHSSISSICTAHKLKTVFYNFPNINQSTAGGLLRALGADCLFAHDSLLIFLLYLYKGHVHTRIFELTVDKLESLAASIRAISPSQVLQLSV